MLTKLALISELLTIDHGKYVVRVMVMNQEEKAIASGLAAAETIEIAEDRARERALALIDNDVHSHFSTAPSSSPSESSTLLETVNQFESKEISANHKTTVKQNIALNHDISPTKTAKSSPSIINNQHELSSTQTSSPTNNLPLIDENQSPQTQDISSQKAPSTEFSLKSPDTDIKSDSKASEEKEIAPAINSKLPSPSSDESINWEIISKTDIELKRLGWTKDQGKNYLLETYGKKSRHLLTDEELIEFCHYLENQP